VVPFANQCHCLFVFSHTLNYIEELLEGEKVGEKLTLLFKQQTQSWKILFPFSTYIISAGRHPTTFLLCHSSECHFYPPWGPDWRHPSSHQPLQSKWGATNPKPISASTGCHCDAGIPL